MFFEISFLLFFFKPMEELLNQIQEEYTSWYNYVKPLRDLYLERMKKYLSIEKSVKKQVSMRVVSRSIDKLISKQINNKPAVSFSTTDSFVNNRKSNFLNSLAFSDMLENDYQQLDYQAKYDKYFFGVWIRVWAWRNEDKKENIFNVIDPLTWIPDPIPSQNGKFNWQGYRFHWFTLTSNLSELRKWGCDQKELLDYANKYLSEDTELSRRATDIAAWFTTDLWSLKINFAIDVYFHYTEYNWERIVVILTKDRKHILKQYALKKILASEKKDKARRPIVLNYFKPMRGRAFWVSVVDVVEDKQLSISKLTNLNLILAQKESLWGDYLYNARLIKNIRALKQPSIDKRYISVSSLNPGETLKDAMLKVPVTWVSDAFDPMVNRLEAEVERDLWFDSDKLLSGASMSTVQAKLLWEVALSTSKTQSFIDFRGERDFWLLWYKGYLWYFTSKDKKIIKDNTEIVFELTRNDFALSQDPNILLVSDKEKQAEIDKQKAYMNAQLPMILQDMSIPAVSKSIAKRYTYRINWRNEKQIMSVCPYSPDEKKANEFLEIINYWQLPLSLFDNEKADFFVYYLYIQNAYENDVKYKVLHTLQEYLVASKNEDFQNNEWKDWMGLDKVANANSNILMNNAIQKQWFE